MWISRLGAAGWFSESALGLAAVAEEGEVEDNIGMVKGVFMLNGLIGLGLSGRIVVYR